MTLSKMKSKSQTRPKVLIIGGSFAGLTTMRYLRNKADVTIVEPRDFFEYSPGILHILTGSNARSRIISSMSDVSKGSTIIRGTFAGISISNRSAYIRPHEGPDNVTEMEFDALVLCTGSTYTYPIKTSSVSLNVEQRCRDIDEFVSSVRRAQSVTVLGGGLVGVEMAAEVAARLPGKDVSLVSRGPLLNTLPASAGRHAINWLKRHCVRVIQGEVSHCERERERERESKEDSDDSGRNSSGDRQICVLRSGERLAADLIVDCTNRSKSPVKTEKEREREREHQPGTPLMLCDETDRHTERERERDSCVVGTMVEGGLVEVRSHSSSAEKTRISVSSSEKKNLTLHPLASLVPLSSTTTSEAVSSLPSSSSSSSSSPSVQALWPYDEQGKVSVDRHFRALAVSPSHGVFAAGDVTRMHSCPLPCAACSPGMTLAPRLVEGLRTAHIADAQAELCARNVLQYLNSLSSGARETQLSSLSLQSYPQDLFFSSRQPLLACVSLGPRSAIVIFNNLVLGGLLFGVIAAVMKWTVETTKIAEARDKKWAQAFWAFAHVLVNVMHALTLLIDRLFNTPVFRALGYMLRKIGFRR
eukprot:CAMPEP_0182421228 /NCGR_PEP_ID=MMETSP1167-20130531/6505_1 /TAXON_ID=2988 /ORGANISM="Mallomonas Sp, Strain CCMP3275" /LENGTH=587 /DNA_ID=CAMNT_0024598137 /DNA_START=92 /DNA_END=1851 /DNA_ORIENTATION=+